MLEKIKNNKFWIALFIIFAIRMILISCQQPMILYFAGNDDAHIFSMAERLLDMDWLGPYTSMTLSKGIFASIFIAVANVLGIPFLTAEHIFYALACLTLVLVLRKSLIKNDAISCGLFAILMFNPVLFCTELCRVYRDYINSSLLIFLVASLFGLFFNYKEKWTKLIKYMVGIGLSFTSMYICREEGYWVLPVIIISVLMTVLFILLDKECLDKAKKIILYIIPVAIFGIIIIIICSLNCYAYGLFTLNQYSGKTWNNLLDALYSVKVEKEYDHVPVSKEAREKIYKVSPAFAELKENFEGEIGDAWAKNGDIEDEIEEGWFSWAFIGITEMAGKYTDAKTVNDYFKQITNEINQAYEDGRLEKKEKEPMFRQGFFNELFKNVGRAHDLQVHLDQTFLRIGYDKFVAGEDEVETDINLIGKWNEILGQTSTNKTTYNYFVDKVKINSLELINDIYKFFSPILFYVSIITYIGGFIILFMKKTRFTNYKEMTFLTGILGLYIIRLFIIAYVETNMFKGAINAMYLSSTYSMLYAFEFLSICFFGKSIFKIIKNKEKEV